MTDSKIKKLDFCGELCEYAEDIINRQKAEIEDLKHSEDVLFRVKEQLKDTIREQKAEIERLQQYYDDMQSAIYLFREDHAKVKFFKKEIKDEAYKELAERLKKEIAIRSTLSKEQDRLVLFYIDNLVKEMVGENND